MRYPQHSGTHTVKGSCLVNAQGENRVSGGMSGSLIVCYRSGRNPHVYPHCDGSTHTIQTHAQRDHSAMLHRQAPNRAQTAYKLWGCTPQQKTTKAGVSCQERTENSEAGGCLAGPGIRDGIGRRGQKMQSASPMMGSTDGPPSICIFSKSGCCLQPRAGC